MDCFYKKEMDEKDLKLIKEKIKRLNSKHIFNLSNVRLLLMIIITALLWIVLLKLALQDQDGEVMIWIKKKKLLKLSV